MWKHDFLIPQATKHLGWWQLTETVIHEMIHHYITTIEKHESIIFKHGWRFKRQCRRLKREFGITIDLYGPKVCHVGNKKPTVPSLSTRFRRFIGF